MFVLKRVYFAFKCVFILCCNWNVLFLLLTIFGISCWPRDCIFNHYLVYPLFNSLGTSRQKKKKKVSCRNNTDINFSILRLSRHRHTLSKTKFTWNIFHVHTTSYIHRECCHITFLCVSFTPQPHTQRRQNEGSLEENTLRGVSVTSLSFCHKPGKESKNNNPLTDLHLFSALFIKISSFSLPSELILIDPFHRVCMKKLKRLGK